MSQSVIEQDAFDDGWYFWESDWGHRQGPFGTVEEAEAALEEYEKNNDYPT